MREVVVSVRMEVERKSADSSVDGKAVVVAATRRGDGAMGRGGGLLV